MWCDSLAFYTYTQMKQSKLNEQNMEKKLPISLGFHSNMDRASNKTRQNVSQPY